MSLKIQHTYHLVDESPWPLLRSISRIFLTLGLLQFFYFKSSRIINKRIILLFLLMWQWWLDVSREGAFQGLHSNSVTLGLRWGIILFIVSEICFFFSFFWMFFHSSLVPTVEIASWPPLNIIVMRCLQVPLLNTFILITSGISVTWAHHALIKGEHNQTLRGLYCTVILGVYFTILQGIEYAETSFRIADRIYGSSFFLATGFHGFHVIVGTCFLMVSRRRINKSHMSSTHHLGFEAAAWYWHFVDVIWLFLFVVIYWWGGV